MEKIRITATKHGWAATFSGETTMPKGIEIPLPLTTSASLDMVRGHVRKLFPQSVIVAHSSLRYRSSRNGRNRPHVHQL
jgi:hypothetical protein